MPYKIGLIIVVKMMKPFFGGMDIAPFCMLIGIEDSKNDGGFGVWVLSIGGV